ncbi:MAG: type II toxin-antitoxin system HipA family toxin, partial [Actinomycetota bacterium]|nr:type II toxin-antitoxin system HipA family toxin [Actinomycetota bacterium]
ALRLDGSDANLALRYFVEFAERFGVPERLAARRVGDMVGRSEPALADLSSIGYDEATTKRLNNEIHRRMETLRK